MNICIVGHRDILLSRAALLSAIFSGTVIPAAMVLDSLPPPAPTAADLEMLAKQFEMKKQPVLDFDAPDTSPKAYGMGKRRRR